jgi:CMP-N,N'-diacetyllegionaminic acid synthase
VPSIVALIPARSGSKRVADKNVRRLGAHPLLAYAIAAARASGIFARVIVSTDRDEYAAIARHYGAEAPFLRPAALAGDTSPDIEWVEHALGVLAASGEAFDCFSILRPTSPFRPAQTIRRAWESFVADGRADSLRAVEKCAQHPGKMWTVCGTRMHPLLPFESDGVPWHSRQYPSLPDVYVQNASLEIAWTQVVREQRSIAGQVVMPFITRGAEGFDVNAPDDWRLAELWIAEGRATLPPVETSPWPA